MNCVFVVVFSICLIHIQTENIYLNPGDEYKYSIFTGDTLTLQCPVNSSLKSQFRWSYGEGTKESILAIGKTLNKEHKDDFRFSVNFTNQLNNVTYLRIYNITSKEQGIYRCFAKGTETTIFEYKYSIRLANVTTSLTRNPNETVCCELNGRNISTIKFTWEQRTLYGEHIRFIESVQEDYSVMSQQHANMDMLKRHIYCVHLSINRTLKYIREGEYECTAQMNIYGRRHAVTTSIKIENIPDRPFCIQDTRSQHSILGTNITISIQFYSKPKYSVLSLRKNNSESKLGNEIVNMKNISLDVYNVTILVSGYEIIIHITEFSEEDVGNYTVNIMNEFGSCDCTVQLLFEGKNYTEKVVIGETKRAELTKSLLWYIVACGSIIVVLFTMSALRSTFLKTVDTCSKPTIRKPSCHKSTEKKATKKQSTKKQSTKKQAARKPRRAYSDQFMEVTLNQLNNGERILIIGQTNEMDASTETNI